MENISNTAPMPPGPSACAQRLWEETRRGRNRVDFSSYTFMGGGRNNQIQAVSNNSVIGGGEDNVMGGGDQRHSVIGGGFNNAMSGRWSGILGGQNNVIGAGLNDTFIVGSNINAVNAGALHVNGLWANGIPGPGSLGAPAGTVYFDNIATLPFPWNTCNVLMIV